MYLLMLLATFVSAIYGYNLSVRPEYDRDIPHKKASAVAQKFLTHHNIAKNYTLKVLEGNYKESGVVQGSGGIHGILPGDIIYSATEAEIGNEENLKDITLVYRTGHADENNPLIIPLSKKGRLGQEITGADSSGYLKPGRYLIPANEMTTKVLCPDMEIDENDVNPECVVTEGSDHVKQGCCGAKTSGPTYLVSYRTLDARWYNRLTNTVNQDFTWIFKDMEYKTNMGIITWDEGKKQWHFQGKIKLYPVYRKEMEKAYEDHKDDPVPYLYPVNLLTRTEWTLPKRVFDKDYFKDKDGNDMCLQSGCLFMIQLL